MWKKLLHTKQFIKLSISAAVLCLAMSGFICTSAFQTAHAQTGCVPVPVPPAGTGGVIGGGEAPIQSCSILGCSWGCVSLWGVATCQLSFSFPRASISCPAGSTARKTGTDAKNNDADVSLCIEN